MAFKLWSVGLKNLLVQPRRVQEEKDLLCQSSRVSPKPLDSALTDTQHPPTWLGWARGPSVHCLLAAFLTLFRFPSSKRSTTHPQTSSSHARPFCCCACRHRRLCRGLCAPDAQARVSTWQCGRDLWVGVAPRLCLGECWLGASCV